MSESFHRPHAPGILHTSVLLRVAVVVAVLVAAFVACRETPEKASSVEPRLVVLYATCTLNREFLAPYAPDVGFTPAIERFAGEGAVFRRHQTEAGQSGTAFASIFTGLQADGHGVFRHPTHLPDEVTTIGEAFRDAGFEVWTWLEHGMASAELGYAQGAAGSKVSDTKLTAEDPRFRALLERLAEDPEARALVVTNFTVTHGPYQPGPVEPFCRLHPGECGVRDADPEAFDRYVDFYRRSHAFLSYDFPRTRERTGMDDEHLRGLVEAVELLYRANVAYLDHLFGRIVEAIDGAGLGKESVVAFTADHGETLYREGTLFKWTHGHQLAPEVLTVPLLVRAPGIAAGDVAAVTRSIDVFPTLAGLAGVTVPGTVVGVDLSPALRGEAPWPELLAFSHTALVAEPMIESSEKWELFRQIVPRVDPELMWAAVRDGDLMTELRPAFEVLDGAGATGLVPSLADLAEDPAKRRNLFDPTDPEARRRLAELRAYREELIRAFRARSASELDLGRQEELLRSLGYVSD